VSKSNYSTHLLVGSLVVIVFFILAPNFVSAYRLELLTIFLINVILTQSYRLMATTGDWTLCHYILMGVGAYATGILAKMAGLPFYVVMPTACIVTAFVSLLFAIPLSRTLGFAFFIASFALGEFVRHVWLKFHYPFGGARGINGIPKHEIGQGGEWYYINFWDSRNFYYFALIFTILTLVILYRIDRSRLGNAWKSIYTDRELSESIGIDVSKSRIIVFCVAGFFAGLAGSLLAYQIGSIDPHNFEMVEMVYLIIWCVVGGVKTYWGPLIGVLSMSVVFELTRPLAEWRPALFGLILILFLVLLPGGLETLPKRIREMLNKTSKQQEAG
jgi:branched-chain amino acid transport system permease protein